MDKGKIDRIFKEWKYEFLLTEDGALPSSSPNERFMVILKGIGALGAVIFTLVCRILYIVVFPMLIIVLPALLPILYFTTLDLKFYIWIIIALVYLCGIFYLLSDNSIVGRFVDRIFGKLLGWLEIIGSKFSSCYESIDRFFTDRMEAPYFYNDRMVSFPSLPIYRKSFYYSDLKEVVYGGRGSKKPRLRITFKGKNKTFVIKEEPGLSRLLYLFGSAFKPIFINEPFYEDMLRLFADVITLRSDSQYQSEGLQCALRYFSESKYRDLDYQRKLTEQVDSFRQYREGGRSPNREHFIDRCMSEKCKSVVDNAGVDYADRLDLLTHLFECAYASDGKMDDEEIARLSVYGGFLCVDDWDVISLMYAFEAGTHSVGWAKEKKENEHQRRSHYQTTRSNRMEKAYGLLRLPLDASLEEVKSAYRAQVKTCHPDTLPSTATDGERAAASIRFRTITEAYDFLCAVLSAEPVSVTK